MEPCFGSEKEESLRMHLRPIRQHVAPYQSHAIDCAKAELDLQSATCMRACIRSTPAASQSLR